MDIDKIKRDIKRKIERDHNEKLMSHLLEEIAFNQKADLEKIYKDSLSD